MAAGSNPAVMAELTTRLKVYIQTLNSVTVLNMDCTVDQARDALVASTMTDSAAFIIKHGTKMTSVNHAGFLYATTERIVHDN